MQEFFGRKRELELLNGVLKSRQPQFLAVYGRRRIGKTYLIDQFFRDKGIYFHFTGMYDASLEEHLQHFATALSERLTKKPVEKPKNWMNAFILLRQHILELGSEKKIIIFFDELPWIATPKSRFVNILEHFWNDFFSKLPNTILIVCGSAASWMINKIIHNKGGLYNRLTEKIKLEPFTLNETEEFLNDRGIYLGRKQLVDLYMATGGVAKYLTYVQRGQSAAEMIQRLCFDQQSPLQTEYDQLYRSIFKRHYIHQTIVETLAQHHCGLTQSELLAKSKLSSGGGFTDALTELKESGFIAAVPALGKKKKDTKFVLSDEYSLFYLTWMKDKQVFAPDHWFQMHGSVKFASWSGYAFESICRKHLKNIIKALGIQVVASHAVHWVYKPKEHGQDGLQLDLIIDRRDQCMNLCEIKYYNNEIHYDEKTARQALFRKTRFKELIKTRKTLFNTLISVYGAKENGAFFEGFDNQLTVDALF